MDRGEVRKIIEGLSEGSEVILTYKKDMPEDPFYLIGMHSAGVIQFPVPDAQIGLIMVIQMTRDWAYDRNRRIEVLIGPNFDLDWFLGRVAYPLESIEVKQAP